MKIFQSILLKSKSPSNGFIMKTFCILNIKPLRIAYSLDSMDGKLAILMEPYFTVAPFKNYVWLCLGLEWQLDWKTLLSLVFVYFPDIRQWSGAACPPGWDKLVCLFYSIIPPQLSSLLSRAYNTVTRPDTETGQSTEYFARHTSPVHHTRYLSI